MRLLLIILILVGCQWKHDGMIVKDKDGNLYRLESNGIRNESYDLKPLPTKDIDTMINNIKNEK